ncbi:MAG: glycosyltransferase [Ignavibacteriaceae bacterium]|jgi:glycosyltransferase involved in cell wall biosynthesis|nr:glycosyltransferase [Ignavibacteriaceae bacterium]
MKVEGLVTIIVPCYNSEKFIATTLKSIEEQTYKNWECIIIDDGSKDGSSKIVKGFEERDKRFKYFFQKNQGSAAAKNAGIEKAKGDFIQFLDADDIILRDKLKICVDKLEELPEADIVYTEYCFYSQGSLSENKRMEDDGYFYQTLPVKIPSNDAVFSFISHWNIDFIIPIHSYLFRRRVFEEIKFDDRFKSFAEDLYCWIMIGQRGFKFEYLGEVMAVYRQTQESSTTKETAIIDSKIAMTDYLIKDERFRKYQDEIRKVNHFFRQRLVMGKFMEKDFKKGIRILREELKYSTFKDMIKMGGWFSLMIFFKKETVVKMRQWIIKNTPIKWGGWSSFRLWTPPYKIKM